MYNIFKKHTEQSLLLDVRSKKSESDAYKLLIVINYKLIILTTGNVYFSILSIIQLYSLLKRCLIFKKFPVFQNW